MEKVDKKTVKEKFEQEINELYDKIGKTKITIKEEQQYLKSYKDKLEIVQSQLERVSLYERLEEIKSCHEEIMDIIEGLGYNFKGGNNSIRIFGEIRDKKDFRDNIKINFNNTMGDIKHINEINVLNDIKIIEKIRTIIQKYSVKCIEFRLTETRPYYYTYTNVRYDREFTGRIKPTQWGRDTAEVWEQNEQAYYFLNDD